MVFLLPKAFEKPLREKSTLTTRRLKEEEHHHHPPKKEKKKKKKHRRSHGNKRPQETPGAQKAIRNFLMATSPHLRLAKIAQSPPPWGLARGPGPAAAFESDVLFLPQRCHGSSRSPRDPREHRISTPRPQGRAPGFANPSRNK